MGSFWRGLSLGVVATALILGGVGYAMRGVAASSVSFILTDKGYIAVDPLLSVETARAALALVKAQLGDKPILAVIYSHSHADHFGGVKGMVDPADVAAGRIKIIAPSG